MLRPYIEVIEAGKCNWVDEYYYGVCGEPLPDGVAGGGAFFTGRPRSPPFSTLDLSSEQQLRGRVIA